MSPPFINYQHLVGASEAVSSGKMKKFLIATSLLHILCIFATRSSYVDATVGLYGPDRYDGKPKRKHLENSRVC